jgi:hypothetical protein
MKIKERNHRRYDVPRGLRQYCAGGRWQQTPTISGGRTSELPTQVALNELHVSEDHGQSVPRHPSEPHRGQCNRPLAGF